MPTPILLRAFALMVLTTGFLSATPDPSPAAPRTVSRGEKIDIADYLVEGKTVIFGFYSAFSPHCPCGPCSTMADPLAELQKERPDLVVIKVNVDREGAPSIDWNSPVVQQFSLRRLPHFKIYGPDGALISQDDQKSDQSPAMAQVHALVEELAAHKS